MFWFSAWCVVNNLHLHRSNGLGELMEVRQHCISIRGRLWDLVYLCTYVNFLLISTSRRFYIVTSD